MNQKHAAEIISFSPEYASDFERLNRQWIEQYFAIEASDRAVFDDPFGIVVAPGGQIFFVVSEGRVWGTCAAIRHSASVFELAKMAVSPEAWGRGYGDLLLNAAVDFSQRAGAKTLILLSNSRLRPALGLYTKHGFREVPLEDRHGYDRVDVKMVLEIG